VPRCNNIIARFLRVFSANVFYIFPSNEMNILELNNLQRGTKMKHFYELCTIVERQAEKTKFCDGRQAASSTNGVDKIGRPPVQWVA
jgi:hypothetical protein